MNFGRIRWLDRVAGDLFATVLPAIWRPAPRDWSSSPPSCIAVSKHFGIGSIILATPLLRGIRQQFPAARLLFVTLDAHVEFVKTLKLADAVYSVRVGSLSHVLRTTLGLLRALRRERVDIFFDLEFFSRYSALVAFLSGSPVRIGYCNSRSARRARLLTHPIKYSPYRHISEIFLAQGEPFGITGSADALVRPELPHEATAAAQRRVHDLPRPFVVACPGKGLDSPYWLWPAECWGAVIRALEHSGVPVVLTGTADDVPLVEEIKKHSGQHISSIAGSLNLLEFAALLGEATVVLTIDSGALHMAAAMGVPAVALFGPETPLLYGHQGPQYRILYKGVPCSPCYNVFDGKSIECWYGGRCMKQIQPREVIRATLELLRMTG